MWYPAISWISLFETVTVVVHLKVWRWRRWLISVVRKQEENMTTNMADEENERLEKEEKRR